VLCGQRAVGVAVGRVRTIAVGEDHSVFVVVGQPVVELEDEPLVDVVAVAGVLVAFGVGAPVHRAEGDAGCRGEVGQHGTHDLVAQILVTVPSGARAGVAVGAREVRGVKSVVGWDRVLDV
jgi:hypothetical protein